MADAYTETDQLAINTIRTLSIDAIQAANSGHPGLPLGAAPMAYVLWTRFLRYNPQDPSWPNRDRFVLSAGHGSMLLYSLLHLAGFDLPLDEVKRFRQWGSKTPGHPESHMTAGVEVSTGPLGQGFGNGVGMAMAEAFLAAAYNRPGQTLIDHYTYGIVSDGDLMEGVASEAASLAGHLKLGKLIYLYDDNLISLDGPTNLAFTEDVLARFAAYGWHTQRVEDGNDVAAIEAAVRAAQAVTDQPSLISVRTVIGYGSPKAGTSKVHGSPLGADGVRATKQALGFDPDQSFVVPGAALEAMRAPGDRGAQLQRAWEQQLASYASAFPAEAAQLKLALAGELPAGWDAGLTTYASGEVATRDASGKAMEELSQRIPWMIGGSADLSESTKTPASHSNTFQPGSYQERVVWFGVREHGMGAALNGMAAHGGVVAFGGTFLTFSDYMRGAIRVAALAHHPVVYVFTHDSIGLGEDGPTHQPVEHVMSLRLIPNLVVLRPADANETVEAWKTAIARRDGPTALILSRQKLPVFDRGVMAPASGAQRGAYVLSEASGAPQVTLIATGSEVEIAVAAQAALAARGVAARVVSMPSWELFAKQDQAYRESVLIPGGARVSIEAGVTIGWERWLGARGAAIGVDTFGASAPYKKIYEEYGLTVAHMVAEAERLIG
jgi:transketolase